MTKETSTPKEDKDTDDEIKLLKKYLAEAKKENDFLKKWNRYLKDQKNTDLDS